MLKVWLSSFFQKKHLHDYPCKFLYMCNHLLTFVKDTIFNRNLNIYLEVEYEHKGFCYWSFWDILCYFQNHFSSRASPRGTWVWQECKCDMTWWWAPGSRSKEKRDVSKGKLRKTNEQGRVGENGKKVDMKDIPEWLVLVCAGGHFSFVILLPALVLAGVELILLYNVKAGEQGKNLVKAVRPHSSPGFYIDTRDIQGWLWASSFLKVGNVNTVKTMPHSDLVPAWRWESCTQTFLLSGHCIDPWNLIRRTYLQVALMVETECSFWQYSRQLKVKKMGTYCLPMS